MHLIRKNVNIKNAFNQKGATLIYALIVITLLIIIGVALSSFALMSVRIGQIDNTGDKAFYLSDAAVEETLFKLNTIAQNAEAEAAQWTQNKTNYYNQPKWLAFTTKLEREVAKGTLSQAASATYLKNATEWEYNKRYNCYLLGKLDNYADTATWLKKDYTLLNNNTYVLTNTIEYDTNLGLGSTFIDKLKKIELNPQNYSAILKTYSNTLKPEISITSQFKNNICEVDFTTNGKYNAAHKAIKMLITMESPQYTHVMSSKSEKHKPFRNQLIDNAVTAGGNIVVSDIKDGNLSQGATTQVIGNAYSYGDFPSTNYYRLPSLGGVLVGYDKQSPVLDAGIGPYTEDDLSGSGHLEVRSGDLITRSAVQLMNNNSALLVDGSTYANGFIASKYSNKVTANIGKDLILIEDLLLNGPDPLITVGSAGMSAGTIWGLMDLSYTKVFSTLKSDISSSIIVNTTSPNAKINCNYVKVAGVAYMSLYREAKDSNNTAYWKAYQTGESFTTNKQSWFYETASPDTGVKTGFTDYTMYGEGEYPNNALDTVKIGLIEYLDDNNQPIEDVKFKSEHFFAIGQNSKGSVDQRDRSVLKVNSIETVKDPNTLQYSITGLIKNFGLGIIIANDLVFNPYYSDVPENDKNGDPVQFMTSILFGNQRQSVLAQFDKKTHLLKTRNLAQMNNIDPTSAPNRFETLTNSAHSYVNITDSNNFAIVTPNSTSNVYINIPSAEKASIASKDNNSPVFIDAIPDDFGASLKSMSGLVVTKGNIFVYNEGNPLHFKGTLVSDKNIVFLGSGNKTIQYDEQVVYKWLVQEKEVNAALYGSEGRQVDIKTQPGSSQLTSSDQGDISLEVKPFNEQVTINVKSVPTYEGALKKPSDFSFKIQKWSIDH